jgi:hypothetical protein
MACSVCLCGAVCSALTRPPLAQCTVMQYIGEMCRYAVATPPHDEDASSGVRLAIGNGLRSDVWPQFQVRACT